MNIDLPALLTFAAITSLTPGPNNISAFSFSANMGFRKTIPYILGIAGGTLLVMSFCAFLMNSLVHTIPVITNYLKYIGALYIVWLAFKTLFSRYSTKNNKVKVATSMNGFVLQLVNPKALIYGVTMYSTFLSGLTEIPIALFLSSAGISIFTFFTVSTWSFLGSLITRLMQDGRTRFLFNLAMAFALLFTALRILECI